MDYCKKIIYLIGYILFVNWLFIEYVSTTWGYLGAYSTFRRIGLSWSLFFSLIPGLFLVRNDNLSVSKVIVLLLYYYTYVPMIVVISYKITSNNLIYLIYAISFSLAFLIIIFFSVKNKFIHHRTYEFYLRIENIAFITFLGMLVLMFKYYSLLNFVNPFGEEIYTQRFAARDSNLRSSSLDYLTMIISGALLPVLLSYGIYKKKQFYILLAILSYFLLYSIAANKGYLFYIPMVYIV